jgi:hypothetical protein
MVHIEPSRNPPVKGLHPERTETSSAQAAMKLNSAEGGSRRFILVRLPEICGDEIALGRAAFKTIADLGKEHIRRAAKKIKQARAAKFGIEKLDVGFRVLKIERSNIEEMCYTPDAVSQDLLAEQAPMRAVFRDAGFASDSLKINVEQIFKLMSPSIEVKTI